MITDAIKNLVSWTHNPDPPERVHELLAACTDEDLRVLMGFDESPGGRLAWAEYGRRRKYFDFEIRVSKLEGRLVVAFEAEGKPVHTNPIVDPC